MRASKLYVCVQYVCQYATYDRCSAWGHLPCMETTPLKVLTVSKRYAGFHADRCPHANKQTVTNVTIAPLGNNIYTILSKYWTI